MDSAHYLKIAPLFAQATFNVSDGYTPVHTRKIYTYILIYYETMCKVLPCIVQLGRLQSWKEEASFLQQIFCITQFSGHHFHNHVIQSILSEAKLCAEQKALGIA